MVVVMPRCSEVPPPCCALCKAIQVWIGYTPGDADDWATCPLKGLRGIELAAGKLTQWTSSVAKQLSSEIVLQGGGAVSDQELALQSGRHGTWACATFPGGTPEACPARSCLETFDRQ